MSGWKFFLLCLIVEFVLLVGVICALDKNDTIFKIYRMNRWDVAIQCLNGNKPLIISRLNKEIIVSCK